MVAGCLLMASCTSDDSNEAAGRQEGVVTFTTGTTRASDTTFDTGDAIGVFASTRADGSLSAAGNYADNAKYLYSSGRFINAGVGIAVPKESEQVHYYGVYPYSDYGAAAYDFTVNADQSTFDSYTKSDLCLAEATVATNEALVPLKFSHAMTRVMVDASESGLVAGTYRIELLAYQHTVSVDMQNQTVTTLPAMTAMNVKMCEDGSNHFKCILPPQTITTVNVAGNLYIGNQPARSIVLQYDLELVSGNSIELKLRKNSNGVYYFDYGGTGNSSIPGDDDADPNPDIGEPTTTIPNIQYICEVVGSDVIVRLDMTGIQNPVTNEWIRLFGTNNPDQNIWISVDDKPKGFTVYNNVDEADGGIKTDVVFVVDNSGSMSQEANAVARDILSWSQTLVSSGLDVRFACVGYSVSGTINGGIDFTDASGLATFLNRSSGTGRTMGFSGSNSQALQSAAAAYRVSDECGAMAIRYANANLGFRSGANRIYVNFTDEPNQPAGRQEYSVEFFASQQNWGTSQGTVHSVYSGYSFTERPLWDEYPWKISEYTGGTIFKTDASFSGVNLNSLPITGALQNSYIIRFHNISYMVGDGKVHRIRITILSSDGRVRAERVYDVEFVIDSSATR